MKVACVGGGPAGLYLSILLKRQDPSHDVTVYERDPEGSTYGWGVTYWRHLLDRLHEQDPESADVLDADSVRWSAGVAHVRGLTTRHSGDQGHGIGRHRLLEILAARARDLGVRLECEREIGAGDLPSGADLIVAADGVRSALRTSHSTRFGSRLTPGRNHYVWLGTTKAFDAFTFAFVETAHGWIWCYGYGYGYGPDRGTCVVECALETWTGLGLDRMSEADSRALLEKLFADVLEGHPLLGRPGGTPWQTFRTLTNDTWHHGNLVLLGDAAHTTHYSIGAGTTLALEDAIALAAALREHPGLPHALARYERERKAASCPCRARPATAPSGTRTCRATCTCPRSACSPCSASVTRPCCPTSRPSCTTGSTGRPGSWNRCGGSSAGWGRRSRGPCTRGRWPRGSSPPNFG